MDVVTSLALLAPANNGAAAGWAAATLGSLAHHLLPRSELAHALDHWAAQLCCGLVLWELSGGVPWLYAAAAAATAPFTAPRLCCSGAGILYMTAIYGDAAAYLLGGATAALFAAQRWQVPHAHAAWHVSMAALGYQITKPVV